MIGVTDQPGTADRAHPDGRDAVLGEESHCHNEIAVASSSAVVVCVGTNCPDPVKENFEAMATPRWRRSPAPSPERGSVSLRLKRMLGLGVILALVGGGCSNDGQLGAKGLSQQSKSLQSEAAEGALLAQDAASGRTTRIYAREHSSDLYRAASQAAVTLNAAKTEPGLEPRLRQLAVLAGQLSAALKRLGSASKDEDLALAHEFHAAAQAIQKIGEGLT
jgi:hypothetical protein